MDVDSEIAFKIRTDKTMDNQRLSSSSDEPVDTSDELLDVDDINERFIADCAREAMKGCQCSQQNDSDLPANEQAKSPKVKAEEVIRKAETARARMLPTPGMFPHQWNLTAVQHSSIVDEKYIAMGLLVDQNLKEKIWKGEFVDFARLLPRNRLSSEETRLELIF